MPKKNKREKRPEDIIQDLTVALGATTGKLNALTLREAINRNVRNRLRAEKHETKKMIGQLRENVEVNTMEAKVATACVNTQYKLLQRLFILRVHESKESIARIKKENADVKADAGRAIAVRDRMLQDKDEQITKLEAHLQSLHFQLERVVLEMVEKMEKMLEDDRLEWETEANHFHDTSVKIMQKLGYTTSYIWFRWWSQSIIQLDS